MSYPKYDQIENLLLKYEFSKDVIDRKLNYQEHVQVLLRNFLSKPTPYENILLYHGVGVGKTCTSISIAEGLKEYVHNMDKRIVVLTKNKTIERNFRNELISLCTGDNYVSKDERSLLQSTSSRESRKELQLKIDRLINKSYMFLTYGTFVNRVLGMKDFVKDDLGNNKHVRKVNGVPQRKKPQDPIVNLNNTVIIVDEAHNITNNDIYVALYKVLFQSYNFRLILLTATPMYDNPKQIFELSNLLNINNTQYHLPIRGDLSKPDANGQYFLKKSSSKYMNGSVLKTEIFNVTDFGLEQLKNSLYGKVSYLRSNTQTNPDVIMKGVPVIPSRKGSTHVVYCEMSEYQYQVYMSALEKDVGKGVHDVSNIVDYLEGQENESGQIGTKTSSLYHNSSDASTMAYPGDTFGKDGFQSIFNQKGNKLVLKDEHKSVLTTDLQKYSCKLYHLLKNILSSQGNVFIYSNYVSNGGTMLIKQMLLANGFFEHSGTPYKNFVVLDEKSTPEQREKYRRVFNHPDNSTGKNIRIIIGSPIVSEGITFKNVRQVHILEPGWNMSRINQIIGRAVRNRSHEALPKEDRNVQVFKYVAHYPIAQQQFFIDKEKYILSEEKDRANKVVERLLKEIGIDCELMRERNIIESAKDGTPECDYVKCNYDCKIKKPSMEVTDKTTYNLYIQTFERSFIQWCTEKIQQMFSTYFIWKLEDIVKYIHQDEPNLPKEVIYTALDGITTNKIPMVDMYGRDGYVFVKGEFYIFNSVDVDINSSIYSKILDFTVEKNKYTLQDYFGKKITAPTKDTKTSVTTDSQQQLSEEIIAFNDNLLKQYKLIGTYRKRGIGENAYGVTDGKFRVIDLRSKDPNNVNDNRKKISGMFIGSYEFDTLVDMVNYLQIKTLRNIKEYTKSDIGKLIENHLTTNGMVLK